MSFNVGDLIAKIRLDTADFQRGISQVTGMTTRLNGGFSALSGNLATAGRGFLSLQGAIAGVGLVALVSNVGMAGAQYARLGETLEVVRKNMGLTTGEIDDMQKALKDANLQGSDATRTLLTFVQSGLSTMTDMEKFTLVAKDYSASIGVSSKEGVQDFTTAIGTLNPELLKKYRLITNLTEIYKEYGDSIGKVSSELDPQEKRMALLNKVYEQHDQTVKGVYKKTYDTASKAISSVKDATSSFKDELGLALEPAIKVVAVQLRDFLQNAISWFRANQDKVAEWGKKIGNVTVKLVDGFIKFVTFLVENKEIIVSFFMAVGVAIAFALGPMLLNPAFLTFVGVWAGFVAVMKLAKWIPELIASIGEKFTWLWTVISGFYELIVNGDFVGMFGRALGIAEDSPIVAGLLRLREAFVQIGAFFTWWWENLVQPILLLIQAIFLRVFFEIAQAVIGELQRTFEFWVAIFTAIWEFIEPWVMRVADLFKQLTAWIGEHMQGASDFISNIWNGVLGFFQNIAGRIRDAIVKPFEDAKNKIEEIGRKIREAAENINPFHRESPSLVDNVRKGLGIIRNEYDSLGAGFSMPGVAGLGNVGGIVINMNGSIGSLSQAQSYGEAMGDQIISKLKQNVRF